MNEISHLRNFGVELGRPRQLGAVAAAQLKAAFALVAAALKLTSYMAADV